MNLSKILVFGATGAQGSPVVSELLKIGANVRAVSRDAGRIQQLYGDKVETATADLSNPESLRKAFEGVDGAFFHLPIPQNVADIPVHLSNVLQAAGEADLKKLVFTTSGTTDERLADSPFVAGNLAAVSAVLASGVPSVVLKPTLYLGNLLQPHILQELNERGVLSYPPFSPTRKISWTALEDQAKFAVAALSADAASGKSFFIASPEPLTGNELAEHLSEQIGRNIEYKPLSPQQFGAGLARVYGEEAGKGIASLYEQAENLPPGGTIVDLAPVLEVLPIDATPVSEWIRRQNWK